MGTSGLPDWDGLLKWSLAHAETGVSSRQISEEDRKWFLEAMQASTQDVIKRMKEIIIVLKTPQSVLDKHNVSSTDIEGVLEELQEHVESIDMANDLHTLGGLVPLLDLLKDESAPVRARAAEVISTMVQNNPKAQQQVMECKGFEALFSNFAEDNDMVSRTKALGAISSLIRDNKSALLAFRLANGYSKIKDALCTDHSRFQRKALQVLEYVIQENIKDAVTITELGFPRSLVSIASSGDADIRQAALRILLQIAKHEQAAKMAWGDDRGQLKEFLHIRIAYLRELEDDELRTLKEERQVLDCLWETCFKQHSPLREHGLLVLAGEDEPPPDVASKFFEPALRSWARPESITSSPTTSESRLLLLSS